MVILGAFSKCQYLALGVTLTTANTVTVTVKVYASDGQHSASESRLSAGFIPAKHEHTQSRVQESSKYRSPKKCLIWLIFLHYYYTKTLISILLLDSALLVEQLSVLQHIVTVTIHWNYNIWFKSSRLWLYQWCWKLSFSVFNMSVSLLIFLSVHLSLNAMHWGSDGSPRCGTIYYYQYYYYLLLFY